MILNDVGNSFLGHRNLIHTSCSCQSASEVTVHTLTCHALYNCWEVLLTVLRVLPSIAFQNTLDVAEAKT